MANPAFKSLIDGLNAQIAVMNENNLKIYDPDNPEFFITGIVYKAEDDLILFNSEVDPKAYLRK